MNVETGILIIQGLTLVALLVYVWKTATIASGTLDLVAETKRSRELLQRPRIVAYFDPNETFIAHIVVENVGAGAASDVTFSFDPPLQVTSERNNAALFFETSKFLGPGHRIAQPLDSWPEYFGAGLPRQYELTIRYRGVEDGLPHETVQTLDADALYHRQSIHRHTMHDLVTKVDRLLGDLKRELAPLQKTIARGVGLESLSVAPVPPTDAAQRVGALWRFHVACHEDGRAFPGDGLALAIRRAALQGLVSDPSMPEEVEAQEKLLQIAVIATRTRYMGDDWGERLGEAIGDLRCAEGAQSDE